MRLAKLWTGKVSPPGPRLPPGQRVYAIGDIHGCHALLVRLLSRIAHDLAARPAQHVTLVYLGDYIDRGPHSAQVLSLIDQALPGVDETIRLKGNHEIMLEQFLAAPENGGPWVQVGGLTTLASYKVDVKRVLLGRDYPQAAESLVRAMPDRHLELIQSLAYSHATGGYFFCHAGVRPGVALDQQQPSDLCWIRREFLDSEGDFGKVVVHGHSPVEEPDVWPNRINVDTGAYATGNLTAVVLEDNNVGFLRA